jgi:hypothetical protein
MRIIRSTRFTIVASICAQAVGAARHPEHVGGNSCEAMEGLLFSSRKLESVVVRWRRKVATKLKCGLYNDAEREDPLTQVRVGERRS